VPLNCHGLADFRVDSAEVLDRLLTQSVTALIAEGLISLDEIAVDGTKVRANASRKSFRTKLLKIEGAVAERLAALKQGLWCKRWRSSQAGAGTRRRSSSEGRIPNLRCGFIFDAKLAEFELTLPDAMHEFDAGGRRRGLGGNA
jgi:hypothetical protein